MANWFFKRRVKEGDPLSMKGTAEGLQGIDNCLATMECVGGQISRDGGKLTIIPNGSNTVISTTYWNDYTETAVVETGEFRTTNSVTVGSLLPASASSTVGTGASPFSGGEFLSNPSYKTELNICAGTTVFTASYYNSSDVLISDMEGPGASYAAQFAGLTGVVTISSASYAINSTRDINISTGYGYCVNGNQVVGDQVAAIADATDAASVITQLNLLLAAARSHGLIAT